MADIIFKCRPVEAIGGDGVHIIYIPAITSKHCDMPAFRRHPKIGAYANSNMFALVVKRALREVAPHLHIRTDNVPPCVKIDRSKFLWQVTISL